MEGVVVLLAVVDLPATRLRSGCSAGGGMVTVVLLDIRFVIGVYYLLLLCCRCCVVVFAVLLSML